MERELLNIAIETAIKAGRRILEVYEGDCFETKLKADDTPITRADKAAHIIITEALTQTEVPVISEEGEIAAYDERQKWKRFWLVDPLDGTKEFVKKNGEFTVNIALIEKNKPILGVIYVPVTQELYYGKVGEQAVKMQGEEIATKQILPLPQKDRDKLIVVGSRSFKDVTTEEYIQKIEQKVTLVSRGSSLKFCMIAEGSADIYPRFVQLKEWDIAAGVAIVQAAGGSVINAETLKPVAFNSESLKTPYFIAKTKK